ncbi:MAG: glycosyltransferase family 2 protein [Alphaproteobacteria bacterium]|nr:glycosyltransferase family 2 protein [Alphaproteobacteria bacterium]
MKKKHLTIVAPVYNEESVILHFYEKTSQVLSTLKTKYKTRFLFVVDRSTDNTLVILRHLAKNNPDVQVLSLSARFGHQMSLLAGIDSANDADVIIMMDSDLQHPPELIPQLLEKYEEGNDIVFTIREENKGIGSIRKYSGKLFYLLLNFISEIPIIENAADYRLISPKIAYLIRHKIRERHLFLRGIFSWVGYNQVGIKFTADKRHSGESKYSLVSMIKLATSGILSFSLKPLQLIIFIGLFFSLLSFFLGLYTLSMYFISHTFPSGWTTLTILLLMFNGINFVFLGIIGAYIGVIFDEVKNRPHYIIDENITYMSGKIE